jgi:hypothetical protein
MTATSAARILWGFYLTPLAVAAASGLLACVGAWFVTEPLDEARFQARVRGQAGSAS